MEYNLIVAGGRDFFDFPLLEEVLTSLLSGDLIDEDVCIVSGMAKGADRLGYNYAIKHKIKCTAKPADWKTWGNRAGFIRNNEMAKISHGVLAFWDGKSKGTKHMIDTMVEQGKDVWIYRY